METKPLNPTEQKPVPGTQVVFENPQTKKIEPESIPPKKQPAVIHARTLATDMAKSIEGEKGSAYKAAAAEAERHQKEAEQIQKAKTENFSFLASGILIVIIAVGSVFGAFWYNKHLSDAIPTSEQATVPSIIRSDERASLDISGLAIYDIATAAKNVISSISIRQGSIKDVIIVKKNQTGALVRPSSAQFLSILEAHVTPKLLSTILPDFMYGMYYYDHVSPFFIFHAKAHDILLEGINNWEPYMVEDIAPMLGIDTSGDQQYLQNAQFKDTLIENRTTRAAFDKDNKPIMFYSFLDENTIIITSDGRTMVEAVARMK